MENISDTGRTTRGLAAQLPRNLAANIAYFLVNIIIGIILVPYFVSTLGVAAYGIIPLATSITGYVGIIVQSLNSAVSRFLTVDLQRGDLSAANKTFNTALFGLTAVVLLMVPIILVVAFYAPSLFNVPAGQESGAILLFLGVFSALLIRSWSGNFTVQLFAFNRLDLQNIVNLVNILVQTGLIVLSFALFGPDIALVGGAYVVGAIVASIVSIVFARKVCPNLNISIRSFDRARIKDLGGMGWWVMVDQLGTLFLFQIDLVVANILFGDIMAGEYAIALQWSILLRSIAGMLAGVIVPTIHTCYARKQTETLRNISRSSVKFMGLAMALPVGLICGFAPQLLTIWVGAEYAGLAPLMVLLTGHLAVNMSVLALFPINTAHNRVRVPGMVTIVLGIMNLALAITIPAVTGWGYYGIAVAGVVILTFRHVLFVPWYVAMVLKTRMITYIKAMIPGTLAAFVIGGASAIISQIVVFPAPLLIVFTGLIISSVYVMIVWRFGITKSEKGLFESFLPQKLLRILSGETFRKYGKGA
jgi:O-antigen/teichoic acid export membrane protein